MAHLDKFVYPEYQDDIIGLQTPAGGQRRFYADLRTMAYTKLHYHDYAELSYYIEGDGVEFINGVGHRLKPGTVTFVLPQQIHVRYNEHDRPVRKYRCMFDLSFLHDDCEDSKISGLLYSVGHTLPSFVDLNGYSEERMKTAFEHLLHESDLPHSPVRQLMISLKLREAVLLFIRDALESLSHTSPYEKEEDNRVWEVIQYVHSHYSENLSLEELTRQFHYSAQHISRSFKKLTGKGFLDYVHELRIKSAVTMLLHTTMPVIDIAVAAGFDSFRTFSRVFRQLKGQTASEFRNSVGRL